MTLDLIAYPNRVFFSQDNTPFQFGLFPYGPAQQARDIKLVTNLQQLVGTTWITRRVTTLYPDQDGALNVAVGSIADAWLKWEPVNPRLQAPMHASLQSGCFRIDYRLFVDNVLQETGQTGDHFIVKGGRSFGGYASTREWVNAMRSSVLFLTSEIPYYYADSPMFVSMLITEGMSQAVEMEFIGKTGSSTIQVPLVDTSDVGSVHVLPVHNILKWLSENHPTPAIFESVHTIKIFAERGNQYQSVHTIRIIARPEISETDLLFINSIGGYQSIRLHGETTAQSDYERTITQLGNTTLHANALPTNMQSTSGAKNSTRSSTGYVEKSFFTLLQSLMLSPGVWQHRTTDKPLLPIIITSKNLAGPSDYENLFVAQVEWQEGMDQMHFHEFAYGSLLEEACPAVRFFSARFINSTNMEIKWILQPGFNRISVGVGGTDYLFYGNQGTEVISFPPATVDGTSISVQGRTFCGHFISSLQGNTLVYFMSLSAVNVINVVQHLNMPPIAVQDIYQMVTGFTTAQTFSTRCLDNDYDPDNDAIECVPVSNQPTISGGRISITEDGTVSYKPPTASFTGRDTFLYTIREVANPANTAQGEIIVNVTNGIAQEVVYAKIEIVTPRNASPFSSKRNVFVRYYSDPMCTIAKDVSGLGLRVNYRIDQSGANVQNFTITASGTQNLIWEGPVQTAFFTFIFTLEPGAGYTII